MEVVRITPRGYCHGVVEAMRIAKRVREETSGEVVMLGMLVHNTHTVEDLQAQGVGLVDSADRLAGLEQIREGTVIFTAHGVSPQVKAKAQAMFDAAEKDGSRVKPQFGSVWYHFMGPDQEHARTHFTVAVPGATSQSLGLPDNNKQGGVWIMNAGTTTAHLMTPGE